MRCWPRRSRRSPSACSTRSPIPAHELMLKEIVARKAPAPAHVASRFEVLPEIKEYERTSTTVINAYVMPIVATYLRALRKGLDAGGIPARLLLMQSNGGLTTDGAAAERPMNIIESGPGRRRGRRPGAGARQGPRQDHHLRHGRHDRQGLDGRGRRGRARPGVRRRRRHHDRLAAADGRRLHAQGAGDRPRRGRRRRRLACLDRRRRRAAGRPGERRRLARPGLLRPGRHGTRPSPTPTSCWATSTRRISSAARSSSMPTRRARCSPSKIAKPLGLPLERAAYGAHLIAASNMIRAIKAVSTERGRDPRDFALFAFGGNGPLFAAGMAAALGINRVVVPPSAGPLLVVRPALRRRRAPLRPHLPAPAAPGRPRRDRRGLGRAGRAGERPARRRGLHRRARPAPALGRPALQGPELRARRCRCPTARSMPRMAAHLEEAFGRGARADLRPSRRPRRAGRAGLDPGRRPGPARGPRRAAERHARAAREPRPARLAPRLFRRRARLARDAGAAPRRSRRRPRRSADRRGVRRRPASCRRAPAPSSTPAATSSSRCSA